MSVIIIDVYINIVSFSNICMLYGGFISVSVYGILYVYEHKIDSDNILLILLFVLSIIYSFFLLLFIKNYRCKNRACLYWNSYKYR